MRKIILMAIAAIIAAGSFSSCSKDDDDSSKYNGHEYVDLGLPSGLKWATCNIGATTPEEYGDYYAWGENETKVDYSWETYKWCNGSDSTMTKYCNNSKYGIEDNDTILDLEDDVAHVKWGGSWRMPTITELSELSDTCNCSWTWTTQNGVYGYKVQSLKSGYTDKYIFLPAPGYRSSSLKLTGSFGFYWSSSLYEDYSYDAGCLFFASSYYGTSGNYRYFGLSVRAVCP